MNLRAHAGKIMVAGTGALLAVSLLGLGGKLLGGGVTPDDVAQAMHQLEGDVDKAKADLKAKHDALLSELPGIDGERIGRDQAAGREVLLSLTDTSATTRGLPETQAILDTRYDFLTPTSRTLTEFIPEWMASTGGSGRVYRLADLQIDVSGVASLDYTYSGLAQLVPAVADENAKSEYVAFTFATTQDGSITSFETYRTSGRSRDALTAPNTNN